MLDFRNAWPTPEEERANAWKRFSLLAQCTFFFLTTLAIAAAFGFLNLISLPRGGMLLIGCVALAEFLIRSHHFWRTGVESALWIGGLYAFIFSLPHSGKPEALLVLAAAAALAGWRVRNALFGTLALVLVVVYFAIREWWLTAMVFAIAVALIALFAVTRSWRRPSTELLWQMLVIVMPVAGAIAAIDHRGSAYPVFAGLAIVFAFVGIRWRLRVPLVASAIAITIAVIDARIPLSLEVQLIAGGVVALIVAATLTRVLRRHTTGFVLDMPQQSELEALLTAGGQAILPVHAPATGAPQVNPQGGEFGGAGASGNF
jgi:hypothetical protein